MFYAITVYYTDGLEEEYYGGYKVSDGTLHIYTQHEGTVNIPLVLVKKYIIK